MADRIADFFDGEDRLGLIALTYAQLTIEQDFADTLISVTATGEYLAVLVGVNAATITDADFQVYTLPVIWAATRR